MSSDELGLIRRAQRGEAAALAKLYDRHYDAVYRYCLYRLGSAAQAEDLSSEVFLRMVERLDTFKSNGRPLLAWLYTIARNLVTDTYRRNGKGQQQSLLGPILSTHDGPAAATEHSLLVDCLRTTLQQLTEDQQQVILLKFAEGYSNAQVAHLMQKTEGAIKSLQFRALAALRRALETEPCYEL